MTQRPRRETYLYSRNFIVHHDFLCKAVEALSFYSDLIPLGADSQVCTNSCLVLVVKPLIYILVHERRLSDAGVMHSEFMQFIALLAAED